MGSSRDSGELPPRALTVAGLIGSCAVVIGLAACGDGAGPGDPANGKRIFAGEIPVSSSRGELPPCIKCHPIVEGQAPETGLGTNLYDIGRRAGTMVPGQSAEEYLRTSIVDPDAYLAGGFQDGLMSREYQQLLAPQQIDDLVAYMLTLK